MHYCTDGSCNTLFHDLFVIDSIPNVNVRFEGQMGDSGVKVEDVGRLRRTLRVEVGVDALHEG